MCETCVKEGKMTQEELNKERKEGVVIVQQILDMLNGQSEESAVNILLSCVINITKEIGIAPVTIITALITGFALSTIDLIPTPKADIPKEKLN